MSEFDDFEDLDEEIETITMTGDDGEELEFYIIDTVKMDGDVYLLLISSDDAENEESDAFIFKQVSEDGEDVVFEEPTEEEFEKVSKLFDEKHGDFDLEIE